jgi:iron-sulfur cluster assembly protein
MINVSNIAKQKVETLMIEGGFNTSTDFIRVGVKSGGCSGLSYELEFDKNRNKSDKLFENNGVKIVVDSKSYLYLIGTTLDYSGGLNGNGFVFNNPNATRTCGCGESFSL